MVAHRVDCAQKQKQGSSEGLEELIDMNCPLFSLVRSSTAKAITVCLSVVLMSSSVVAGELPLVLNVEQQPLISATARLVDALEYVGAPLSAKDNKALQAALKDTDAAQSIRAIQKILDPYCLAVVNISA